MRLTLLILLTLIVAGCTPTPATDDAAPATDTVQPIPAIDPDAPVRRVYALVIYDVAVPAGELSVNSDLWKRIDEQAVDVATYDLLFKNGLRVGVGPGKEFEHVRSYIGDPDAKQITISDLEDRSTYLVMKEQVPEQTVTYFDDTNELIGRQFDVSENRMHVGFRRTPRTDDALRVSMTPSIAHRFRDLRITPAGRERPQTVEDETMFHDVNLRVDVPVGDFLLVAPSDDSDLATSLGHALLREERGPDLVERALLIVPTVREIQPLLNDAPASAE